MGYFIGCGMVITCEDKFVLVQESRAEKSGSYNLPAGTLELDEDIVTCISREVREEVGVDVRPQEFLGVYQTVVNGGSNVIFIVCSGSAPKGARFQSDEHSVIKTLTYSELADLDRAGQLRSPIVLKAVEDYRAGNRLPLTALQSWFSDKSDKITVTSGH